MSAHHDMTVVGYLSTIKGKNGFELECRILRLEAAFLWGKKQAHTMHPKLQNRPGAVQHNISC